MSSGLRIGLLGLFAAVGVGLAICVATSDTLLNRHGLHADQSAGPHRTAAPNAASVAVTLGSQVATQSPAVPAATSISSNSRETHACESEVCGADNAASSSIRRPSIGDEGHQPTTETAQANPWASLTAALSAWSKPVRSMDTAVTDVSAARLELKQPISISPSDGPLEPKIPAARMTLVAEAPEPPKAASIAPVPAPLADKTETPTIKTPTPKTDAVALTQPIVSQPAPAVTQQIPAAGSPQVRRQVQDELTEMRALLEAAQKNPSPESGELPTPAASGAGSTAKPSVANGAGPTNAPPVRAKPKITRVGEGDDHLTLDFQEADIRDVLEMISTEGQLNILPSNSVKGKVSASLHDVDLETALSAILKSTGYVTRRHGKFIYVGTAQDFQSLEQSLDRVGTRIYRTNYVRATDLQALITPLLTQGVGAISVTVASEQGIAADSSKAGGDTFAGGEAVLVRDYEAVLAQIDQVVAEIDRRPLQVAIEAMILSVKLDDSDQFGINFQLLRDKSHLLLASGSPATSLGDVNFNNGGLTFGFLDTTLGAFLNAVETIGDTHVIATPRVVCINKHRAEILIGSQLGYVSSTVTETSTAQNVNFLEVGTQLRLRPFISSDGLIRMEVHPELSTGQVTIQQGFTLPQKDVTQVTTNVMVRDGATVVIGGLIREDLSTNTTQIPLLGNLPGIGFLFRQKNETTQRSEILVLITPHIVYDNEACSEGSQGAEDFHRREAVYADQMSPIGKRHLGRQYLRLAQEAWTKGDQPLAIRFVDLSIHFDPLNRAAIDLRSDIMTGDHFGRHTAVNFPEPQSPPAEGQPIPGWMLNALEQPPVGPPGPAPLPLHPLDPGQPGQSTPIERPRQFQPQ